MTSVSRRSRDTITRIKNLNKNEIDSYRQLKRREFIYKAWQKIWILFDKITPDRCSKAKVNQLTTAIGTLYDKAVLVERVADSVKIDDKDDFDFSKLELDEVSTLVRLLEKAQKDENQT